jgi:hypothetical protein
MLHLTLRGWHKQVTDRLTTTTTTQACRCRSCRGIHYRLPLSSPFSDPPA